MNPNTHPLIHPPICHPICHECLSSFTSPLHSPRYAPEISARWGLGTWGKSHRGVGFHPGRSWLRALGRSLPFFPFVLVRRDTRPEVGWTGRSPDFQQISSLTCPSLLLVSPHFPASMPQFLQLTRPLDLPLPPTARPVRGPLPRHRCAGSCPRPSLPLRRLLPVT